MNDYPFRELEYYVRSLKIERLIKIPMRHLVFIYSFYLLSYSFSFYLLYFVYSALLPNGFTDLLKVYLWDYTPYNCNLCYLFTVVPILYFFILYILNAQSYDELIVIPNGSGIKRLLVAHWTNRIMLRIGLPILIVRAIGSSIISLWSDPVATLMSELLRIAAFSTLGWAQLFGVLICCYSTVHLFKIGISWIFFAIFTNLCFLSLHAIIWLSMPYKVGTILVLVLSLGAIRGFVFYQRTMDRIHFE